MSRHLQLVRAVSLPPVVARLSKELDFELRYLSCNLSFQTHTPTEQDANRTPKASALTWLQKTQIIVTSGHRINFQVCQIKLCSYRTSQRTLFLGNNYSKCHRSQKWLPCTGQLSQAKLSTPTVTRNALGDDVRRNALHFTHAGNGVRSGSKTH